MKKFLMIILCIILIITYGNIMVFAQEQSSYNTRELSRDENYKLIEMYVYDNNRNISRRITFELPVEWHISDSSVVGLSKGDDIYPYILKADMWDVISTTREDTLNEFNNSRQDIEENYDVDIIEEDVYSTENYEVMYYKFHSIGEAINIHCYYLYANGERFVMTGYVFYGDKPEYNDIFKRIAESLKFQFNVNEVTYSPATGDNILIHIIFLLFILVILIKKINVFFVQIISHINTHI